MPPADISGRAPESPHGRRAAFTPRVWRRSDWTRRSRTRPCRAFHCRSGFCWSCRCFVFGFCPFIGGALRTGGGLTACRFAVLTDRPTLLLRFQRHFKRQSERR